MTIGLNEQTLTLLQEIFQCFPEIEEVRVFGSRAMNNYQNHSDIDLVIWGNLAPQTLGKLTMALDDLPLAQMFDVQIYTQITHSDLKEHINQYGQTIYQKHLETKGQP